MVAPLFYMHLLRVEEQEETRTRNLMKWFPHVFAHAHDTELSHSESMYVQKMAKF